MAWPTQGYCPCTHHNVDSRRNFKSVSKKRVNIEKSPAPKMGSYTGVAGINHGQQGQMLHVTYDVFGILLPSIQWLRGGICRSSLQFTESVGTVLFEMVCHSLRNDVESIHGVARRGRGHNILCRGTRLCRNDCLAYSLDRKAYALLSIHL